MSPKNTEQSANVAGDRLLRDSSYSELFKSVGELAYSWRPNGIKPANWTEEDLICTKCANELDELLMKHIHPQTNCIKSPRVRSGNRRGNGRS